MGDTLLGSVGVFCCLNFETVMLARLTMNSWARDPSVSAFGEIWTPGIYFAGGRNEGKRK